MTHSGDMARRCGDARVTRCDRNYTMTCVRDNATSSYRFGHIVSLARRRTARSRVVASSRSRLNIINFKMLISRK
ncbi:hypothetical protein PUN28_002109 [Cardiocondyla obscurior]|uniref:Uncharacterized protein n=1 Tax=Cardiocondyla obscurior TaxID=286306 RepID=A0AAW2GSU1_9HYME